jgi:hypothetical protein
MTKPHTGGCLCGAVCYECSGEPVNIAHCFCTDCQKSSGTQMSTNLLVPTGSVKVTRGKLAQYAKKGDNGKTVTRFFCAACGSTLWSEGEVVPGVRILKAGSLDDSSWVKPGASIFMDSAPKWAALPQGVATFGRMPPPG